VSYASDRLRAFHEAFGVPSDATPLAEGRRTLHEEEHVEVHLALTEQMLVERPFVESTDPDAPELEVAGRGRIKVARVVVDEREVLEHVAEELADEMVLLYGTADVLGIDLDVAFRLKMAANMAKLPDCEWCEGDGEWGDGDCPRCHGTGKGRPIKRADGKVLKPEGWQKPSMAEAIK
jgi:predicted HAD superfamily Cof-like phosphohydrolase